MNDMRSFEGKTLQGRYLLQKMLGQGNFGAVYRSEHYMMGARVRRVAVKLSKQGGFDEAMAREVFADAFTLAEAVDEMTDASARMHMVQVFDLGLAPEVGNRGFVVMEFVQGTTLAHQFESLRRVPANLLLKWSAQICRGLEGLHTLVPPILHRDLKPDNILLGVDNTVRIVDFGLSARLLQQGIVPGVAGTTAYMAPETTQAQSVPGSDVYSIGLILYEGMTGQHPFKHLTPPPGMPEKMHSNWLCEQKSRIRPNPPSALAPGISPDLDAIVLRCLEYQVGRRYLSAGELRTALEGLGKSRPGDEEALQAGHAARTQGDRSAARRHFERGLRGPSSSKETRFALLRGQGEVLLELGDLAAAAILVEGWGLARASTVLPSREDRANYLRVIARAYRAANNDYQAKRYDDLATKEQSGRTGG